MYRKNYYMNIAIKQAKIAHHKREIPVGAVLVFKEKIIIKGYNKTIKKNPINHAEILILKKAIKIFKRIEIQNSSIYITLEPCIMCTQAINLFKLKKITFGAYNTKEGGIEHRAQIFQRKNSYKKMHIVGGILEEECGKFLKNYFNKIRKHL